MNRLMVHTFLKFGIDGRDVQSQILTTIDADKMPIGTIKGEEEESTRIKVLAKVHVKHLSGIPPPLRISHLFSTSKLWPAVWDDLALVDKTG